MLEAMTAAELKWWLARREFLGAERQDFHAACIRSDIANYAGKSLKEGVWINPLDRMAFREKDEEQLSEEPQPPQLVASKLARAFAGISARQKAAREARERAERVKALVDQRRAEKRAERASKQPPSKVKGSSKKPSAPDK